MRISPPFQVKICQWQIKRVVIRQLAENQGGYFLFADRWVNLKKTKSRLDQAA